MIALFLYWPFRWYRHYKKPTAGLRIIPTSPIVHSPLTVPLLLLVFWLPVTLWSSDDRNISWMAIGYLLFGLTLFVALVHWSPVQRQPAWVAWFLLLGGAGLAIIAPPFVAWKPEFRLFHLPLYNKLQAIHINIGETIHANVLAGVLVIVLPLLLALLLHGASTGKIGAAGQSRTQINLSPLMLKNAFVHQSSMIYQFCFTLLFLLILGVLVLTQSRGGYLAIVIALPVVLLLRWPRLLYAIPIGLLIAFLIVHQVGIQTILNQLSTDGSLGGWDGRLDIWTQSFNALHDFAFTGIGIGTFTLIIPLLYPLHVSIEGYPHAHNLFLQIGVDMGLPGLIAYLALWINLFVMLITVLRTRHATSLQRTLAIGATGSLTAMLVHGLLDAVTWGTKLAFIPWLLFALITLLFLDVEKGRVTALNP
ncbi:MAG: O-antigen ligase family protein [Caldilineaceae bacterium]